MTEETISEPQEIKEPLSVGAEFIEWAEKYWHLDTNIRMAESDRFDGEVCDYSYMRKMFIEKINSLIKQKLGI